MVLCLRVNIIQLLCQIMTKMDVFGVLEHGVVDFGVGLSIHHQARFKRLYLVIIAGGLFCLGCRLLGILIV